MRNLGPNSIIHKSILPYNLSDPVHCSWQQCLRSSWPSMTPRCLCATPHHALYAAQLLCPAHCASEKNTGCCDRSCGSLYLITSTPGAPLVYAYGRMGLSGISLSFLPQPPPQSFLSFFLGFIANRKWFSSVSSICKCSTVLCKLQRPSFRIISKINVIVFFKYKFICVRLSQLVLSDLLYKTE